MRRFLILIAIFTTIGCQLFTPKSSVLDDLICSPPCWQNIVPGISTKQDALSILSELPYIDKQSIRVYDPKQVLQEGTPDRVFDEIIDVLFASGGPSQTTLGIYLIGGKVSVISLQLYSSDVSLSEAIEKLGEPQSIVITPYAHNFVVGFVDPSKGVALTYSTVGKPKRQLLEIYPEIKVSSIYFFDPESFEQFLDSRRLTLGQRDGEETIEHLEQWAGYGKIEEKYPIELP